MVQMQIHIQPELDDSRNCIGRVARRRIVKHEHYLSGTPWSDKPIVKCDCDRVPVQLGISRWRVVVGCDATTTNRRCYHHLILLFVLPEVEPPASSPPPHAASDSEIKNANECFSFLSMPPA